MSELKMKHIYRQEEAFPTDRESDGSVAKSTLTRSDLINAYHVAEFVTLTHDGSPVCWPLAPDLEGGRLLFNTGYVYPTKARNAQRNPRVAALFSDPTASGRADDDPLVLVQGVAEVFDQDLQRNTERYVDQILRKGPILFRLMVRAPVLRQAMVGYLARIWIEVIPRQEYVWERGYRPPEPLRRATRPTSFAPRPGIELPEELFTWLPRYTRPPILAYVDRAGWPAAIRVQATIRRGYLEIGGDLERCHS